MFLDSCSNREKTSFYKIYREGEEQLYRDWTDCYAVGTGDICIHVYTEYEGETEDCIYGDVNRDGRVNAIDLSLLKQVLLGSERTDMTGKRLTGTKTRRSMQRTRTGFLHFCCKKKCNERWAL